MARRTSCLLNLEGNRACDLAVAISSRLLMKLIHLLMDNFQPDA